MKSVPDLEALKKRRAHRLPHGRGSRTFSFRTASVSDRSNLLLAYSSSRP
jgi:hypothetical protein